LAFYSNVNIFIASILLLVYCRSKLN